MSDAGNEKWKDLIYIPFIFLKSHRQEALRNFLACSWYNTNNKSKYRYKYTELQTYHHTIDIWPFSMAYCKNMRVYL